MFSNRKSIRFFCTRTRRIRAMLNIEYIMATINAGRTAQRAFPLKEWMNAKRSEFSSWLNTESKFFTHLCGFPVPRLLAVRAHLLFLCMSIAACTVEQHPAASVVAALCAGYLAWRINRSDKERKGGEA